MSAIFGLYYLDGREVERGDLESMAQSLSHRGPDGGGAWHSGPLGLGQCMLWTTPESRYEQLPLSGGPGGLALTADARIDNREELIAALGLKDRSPERIADSELILGAYAKWGEDCPQKLVGDFAFAIWDGPRHRLFCARDPMGIKPLYYYRSNRCFAFASEVKGLFCLPEVPQRLDEVMVGLYLAMFTEVKGATFYQDILQLQGGHSLVVHADGIQVRSYWSLDPQREVRYRSDDEYAQAFREIFTEAVRCRLRSAYPVGSMLSGGLDSSSIVCVARQLLKEEGRRLQTFSAVFPDLHEIYPPINENPFIQAVIASGDLDHQDVLTGSLTSFSDPVLREFEHVPAPNMYLDWAVFQAAHQRGVRVIFSGVDGDCAVGYGYEYLAELLRALRWVTLRRETRALAARYGWKPQRVFWRFAFLPQIPQAARRLWHALRRDEGLPWDPRSVIRPDFAHRLDLAERMKRLDENGGRRARTAREGHWLSLTTGLWADILEAIDDMTAAFPIEVRYPFFDRRLLEFCLALPGDQKLRSGWNRYVLRRAMQGVLPPEVQWRASKGRLGANFALRLLEAERSRLESCIYYDAKPIAEWVDIPALREAYGRYASDPLGTPGEAFTVFWTTALAVWLERAGLLEKSKDGGEISSRNSQRIPA